MALPAYQNCMVLAPLLLLVLHSVFLISFFPLCVPCWAFQFYLPLPAVCPYMDTNKLMLILCRLLQSASQLASDVDCGM